MEEEKRLMSCYVPVSLHNKRKSKGMTWESVIRKGLEDVDNSLAMNERFQSLFDVKVRPMMKELQKRIFDLEQENEQYINRLIEVREGKQ